MYSAWVYSQTPGFVVVEPHSHRVKHIDPRRRRRTARPRRIRLHRVHSLLQVRRHVRQLPLQEGSFRVRHHCCMPTIGRTERRNAPGRSVGIHRVSFCSRAVVIAVSKGREALLGHHVAEGGIREEGPSFSVAAPDAKYAVRHPSQKE